MGMTCEMVFFFWSLEMELESPWHYLLAALSFAKCWNNIHHKRLLSDPFCWIFPFLGRMERWCGPAGESLGGDHCPWSLLCLLHIFHIFLHTFVLSHFVSGHQAARPGPNDIFSLMGRSSIRKDNFCVSQLNTSLMLFPTPINNTFVGSSKCSNTNNTIVWVTGICPA